MPKQTPDGIAPDLSRRLARYFNREGMGPFDRSPILDEVLAIADAGDEDVTFEQLPAALQDAVTASERRTPPAP